MITLKLAQQPMVVIADTELINQILRKRPKPFCLWRVAKSILAELRISGVEAAEGESWKRQRQFVMQAIGADHLHQSFATIVKVTERLKNHWQRVAYDQRVTEIQKDLMRFVVDTLTRLAFGYDMNTIEKEGDVIQQCLEKIVPTLDHRIDSLLPHLGDAALPTDHDFDKDINEILKVVDELIQFNRKLLAQDPGLAAKPTNFLQSMLVAVEKQDSQLTEADVVNNILTLLLAGEPTTAGTLRRIVYFMTEYPEVQKKMQEEADKVLGDTEIVKDLRQIERLEYIEAVAYESMRMKSVSRLLFVEPNEDVELDGIQIPRGTALALLIGYGALQERNFTVAEKFEPERWLAQYRSSYEVHNTKAFLPFGAGPRFCPGRNLALLEIKSVIAMLCRNFNITSVDGLNSMAEQFASTVMPINRMTLAD